jgi:post-segregation antitoxin (ccd killing protein)
MKVKGKKAQVQITLAPESVEKARNLGLNISKIAQNAFRRSN